MIRVVLVDDQAMVRSGLARIVSLADGLEVVGEYEDGGDLVLAVKRHRPDVVLLDVRMRDVDGVTALRRLQAESQPPRPPVLVLTTFDDDDVLWDAIGAGAAGFMLKDSPAEDLIRAVRAVADGAAWLDPAVTTRVLARHRAAGVDRSDSRRLVDQLSERELDVLRLLARGATNREIAEVLIIGEGTVKTHIGSIYSKVGARDRAAAIVFAFDHGIVSAG
ncbi:MAG: response regulator transcription factor [Actinomycetota bacterium]